MADSGSPTDNSATLTTTFSTTFDTSHSQPSSGQNLLDVTRDELEKRELLHTVQLLRLEVSQKQLVIEALKTERATELEEMREQLADGQHENKLLKLRLQSLTHAYEKEMENVRKIRAEPLLQQVLLSDMREELEQAFDDAEISQSDYEQLKGLDNSLWTTSQLVKVHCHELTRPLHSHIDELQASLGQLNQQLSTKDSQLAQHQQQLEKVREEKARADARCSSLTEELASVRALVQEGSYKINNFDAVKADRDSLRSEVESMKKNLLEQESRETLVKEQLDKSTRECLSAQQTVVLLRQDKDYLTGQVSVLRGRMASAEEKIDYLNDQLSEAKLAKENLYKQLIADKEQCRVDYDLRLQRELDELKSRTALHIEQLKLQTREFYERENHSLSEARNSAITDKDRALTAEKETRSLYEQLLKNYHSLQASSERQCSELQAQLKITEFEKERVSIAHHETLTQLKHCQLEREKLQKKFDLLSVELSSCQREGEANMRRLEEQLVQVTQRLEGYEKIEKELDDIVLQSAQLEHECDAERVLFSYGFGTSIPTNSRRRLQQSVQLARRVLQLEKLNSSLRQQLGSEQSRATQLKQQLLSVEDLLSKTCQPQSMIVESLREKERCVRKLEGRVKQLEAELATSIEERARLTETKNLMAADLEKLLSHREELHHMKQVLVGVAKKGHRPMVSCDQEPALHVPPPTLFTKRDRRKGQCEHLSPPDR